MKTSFTVNIVKNNDNRQNNKYIKLGDEKT
mgnify:FL=1